jgi:PKD repeat protein
LVFDSETDYGELYGTQFILPSGKLNTGVTYRWEMASHGAAGWSYDRTDGGKKFSGEWYFTTELPNSPPKAVVTPDAWYGVKSGEKITLDASKSEDYDGEIVSFEWDFGDGQTAMGENIEHRFRGAMKGQKTYTVTLRVEDDDGNFGIDTAFIGVLPLEKTIEVTRSPMEFGKFAKMTAHYNWIGITDDTGEDVYIVSNIHLDGENYCSYLVSVWDEYSLSVGTPCWSDGLFSFWIGVDKDFNYPFGSYRDKTYTFEEGYYEGMAVGPNDIMRLWVFDFTGGSWGFAPTSKGVSAPFEPTYPARPLTDVEQPNSFFAHLGSPGELCVYDSQGNVTGLVNGEVIEQIPDSGYDNGLVIILNPLDSYQCVVFGTNEGKYDFSETYVENATNVNFATSATQISPNATHEYTVNWTLLSQGGAGVTLKKDENNDGEFEETITIQPPIANFTYTPEKLVVSQIMTFDASNSIDLDGNITNYRWDFGDGTNGTGEITTHSYSLAGDYTVILTVRDDGGATTSKSKMITISSTFFDTGSPANPYPSIMGNHIGTITPNVTIVVSKLYTYPCAGTGGHTEYARIWNNSGLSATANWSGYTGDWHTIIFNKTFVLYKNKTYNYTIHTGSYPQIIHAKSKDALAGAGTITCDKFIDANGKGYTDWIPAIKLFQ